MQIQTGTRVRVNEPGLFTHGSTGTIDAHRPHEGKPGERTFRVSFDDGGTRRWLNASALEVIEAELRFPGDWVVVELVFNDGDTVVKVARKDG